jgi:hypothetical protein
MNDYYRTWHLKIDVDIVKDIINQYQSEFVCPFSNIESYLNIYKGRKCDVQFFNLQHCDYSKSPSKEGEKYIKYLMSVERKLGNTQAYDFLKSNYEKFSIETNEENFTLKHQDSKINQLVNQLQSMWAFDASQRPKGNICRSRIVKLPAHGTMPYHRDETSDENIRVICPIITNDDVDNAFRDKNGERIYKFPATGHFYTFDDSKIEHAVFNNSDQDRYALIFTVVGVSDLKHWDREYYKNKVFWENWSRGC